MLSLLVAKLTLVARGFHSEDFLSQEDDFYMSLCEHVKEDQQLMLEAVSRNIAFWNDQLITGPSVPVDNFLDIRPPGLEGQARSQLWQTRQEKYQLSLWVDRFADQNLKEGQLTAMFVDSYHSTCDAYGNSAMND